MVDLTSTDFGFTNRVLPSVPIYLSLQEILAYQKEFEFHML